MEDISRCKGLNAHIIIRTTAGGLVNNPGGNVENPVEKVESGAYSRIKRMKSFTRGSINYREYINLPVNGFSAQLAKDALAPECEMEYNDRVYDFLA